MPNDELVHCGSGIADVFEAVAAHGPQRVAVATTERTVTYAGLNDRADRLPLLDHSTLRLVLTDGEQAAGVRAVSGSEREARGVPCFWSTAVEGTCSTMKRQPSTSRETSRFSPSNPRAGWPRGSRHGDGVPHG